MNQGKSERACNGEATRLRMLVLAFFAPVYLVRQKLELNIAMVTTYAGIYLKRNSVAAVLTVNQFDWGIRHEPG